MEKFVHHADETKVNILENILFHTFLHYLWLPGCHISNLYLHPIVITAYHFRQYGEVQTTSGHSIQTEKREVPLCEQGQRSRNYTATKVKFSPLLHFYINPIAQFLLPAVVVLNYLYLKSIAFIHIIHMILHICSLPIVNF